MNKQRYLSFPAVILGFALVLVAGCDVSVLYPPFEDQTTIEDPSLLAVVEPDGSRDYTAGDIVHVVWSGWVDAASVSLDLFRYGQFAQQISATTPNSGTYDWTIPADFDAVSEIIDEYQVVVRAKHPDHSPGDLYLEARSETFTIVPAATGGLSDVTVSERSVTITVVDNGTEIDGDTINILLDGNSIVSDHVLVAAPGTDFDLVLSQGANVLEIVAVNEGSISPNTAQLLISNVVQGVSDQEWRLAAGESGTLTITAP
jgi:hypothetical protein